METIQLKCKNCNAIMEVDEEKQEAVCPYCGAREKLVDSDMVAVEKIKSKTYKEMELARMENENRKQADAAVKEEQKSYRKSKLSIVTLVFTFISLFMMFSAFGARHILSGIIALFQTGLFAVSWLMGMRILKDKKRFLHVALAMLGFLLLIPYMMCGQESGKQEELRWPTRGLAQKIPDPKAEYGNIIVDDTDKLYASIDQYSADNFDTYVSECQSMGYTIDKKESGDDYEACNAAGYKLSLSYYTDSMTIEVDAPGTYDVDSERADIHDDTDSTDRADATESEVKSDKSDAAKDDSGTGTDTKKEKKKKSEKKDNKKVDPDLKAFLDDYEDFVDQYVKFMKEYQKDSTNLQLISDYADMVQKEADFSEKLAKYDSDTMSAADAAYYAKVTARCTKKLAEAAQ